VAQGGQAQIRPDYTTLVNRISADPRRV